MDEIHDIEREKVKFLISSKPKEGPKIFSKAKCLLALNTSKIRNKINTDK